MANRANGEIEVQFQGRPYILLPNFRGLSEIQDRLDGVGLGAVAGKIMAGKVGVQEVAAILYGGMVGYWHSQRMRIDQYPFTWDEFSEALVGEGYAQYTLTVTNFVASALRGPKKKPEPPPQESIPESDAQA